MCTRNLWWRGLVCVCVCVWCHYCGEKSMLGTKSCIYNDSWQSLSLSATTATLSAENLDSYVDLHTHTHWGVLYCAHTHTCPLSHLWKFLAPWLALNCVCMYVLGPPLACALTYKADVCMQIYLQRWWLWHILIHAFVLLNGSLHLVWKVQRRRWYQCVFSSVSMNTFFHYIPALPPKCKYL